jgi:hypothetical protein
MLAISLSLLGVGAVLLLLAWRGRITARGRFCRRCRFDLAGLTDPPACPECGRDLAAPRAARPTLRRPSRAGLVLAGLLLLAGASGVVISATNNTARLLAALPDPAILPLHAIGLDAAFTEIATNRLARVEPLPDRVWERLIADALALQADPSRPWDPRHGEVLAHALVTGRMSNDQFTSYADHAAVIGVTFPEFVRHGADSLGVTLERGTSTRAGALNPVGSVSDEVGRLSVRMRITKIGVREPPFAATEPTIGGTTFSVPGPTGSSSASIGAELSLDGFDWSAVEPDTDLTIQVSYEIEVHRSADDTIRHAVRATTDSVVRVLHPDAEIVALATDTATVGSFFEEPHARLWPLYLAALDETKPYRGSASTQIMFTTAHLPVAVAAHAYVIHAGRETYVGSITANATPGIGLRTISWFPDPDNPADEALLREWHAAGAVTIELRPDHRLAEQTPTIREILGVPLRFENVQVTDREPPRTGFSEAPGPQETVGRPVTGPAATPDTPADPED